ncbi:MAG: response regulator [Deltaproteobacteria bacterium]|nr:response regulator [Deltaproteobacteria bacterium]
MARPMNYGNTMDGVSHRASRLIGRRILVVENDDAGREALAQLLVEEGYVVDTARSGIEALDRIDLRKPDLIVSDVQMPNGSGLELAAKLRSYAPWAEIPIVLVTAWGEPRHVPEGLEELAQSSLHKPIDFDGLLAEIESVLATRRQRA